MEEMFFAQFNLNIFFSTHKTRFYLNNINYSLLDSEFIILMFMKNNEGENYV